MNVFLVTCLLYIIPAVGDVPDSCYCYPGQVIPAVYKGIPYAEKQVVRL